LLAAATAVESTLPAPKAPPGTFFRLEDKAFVRSRREFAVSARMDHIAGVWVVSCDSNCDDWKSGAQRCPGAFSAEQALDWAEQLWACHRQRAAPAALSASDFIRVYVGSHAPLPLHAVTLA
jgi:hypothetical protein